MTYTIAGIGLKSAQIGNVNDDGSITELRLMPTTSTVQWNLSSDVPIHAFKMDMPVITWTFKGLSRSQWVFFRNTFGFTEIRYKTLHRQRLAHKRWLLKRGIK